MIARFALAALLLSQTGVAASVHSTRQWTFKVTGWTGPNPRAAGPRSSRFQRVGSAPLFGAYSIEGLADVPPSISSGFRRHVLCGLSSAGICPCRSQFPRSRSSRRARSALRRCTLPRPCSLQINSSCTLFFPLPCRRRFLGEYSSDRPRRQTRLLALCWARVVESRQYQTHLIFDPGRIKRGVKPNVI